MPGKTEELHKISSVESKVDFLKSEIEALYNSLSFHKQEVTEDVQEMVESMIREKVRSHDIIFETFKSMQVDVSG